MQQKYETEGLIMFSKVYREQDRLVKVFTESFGKLTFLVKRANRVNNPVGAAIQPFTQGVYIGKFNSEGLSFLNATKSVKPFKQIQQDIFINAYATYILNLVDVAIEDHIYDPALYGFVKMALTMLEEKCDPEIITNIFEVQILDRFGVAPHWNNCVVCGNTQGKFDYSSKYNGVLCERHWHLDEHRYHVNPKAIYFVRLFANVQYEQIQNITLQTETKKQIRQFLDELYDEYVGIALKSKKFIDKMADWQSLLAPESEISSMTQSESKSSKNNTNQNFEDKPESTS